MGGNDKQVSFEDAHSSASDEDAKAVEVIEDIPRIPMPCLVSLALTNLPALPR